MSKQRAADDVSAEDLLEDFRQKRPIYELFTHNITNLLETLLRSQNIEYLHVEKRTKEIDGFFEKINRTEKKGKYSRLSDITDLSGVRIVTYYESDTEKVASMIKENFLVDIKNSIDKRQENKPDQFGYLSLHFVVGYDDRRDKLTENIQFQNLKAEVQVRTVLQHAWAVLDRRLRYNNKLEIPNEVKRKLFRIAAQLEGADDDLSEVEEKTESLRKEYQKRVESGQLKIELNRESLSVFLKEAPIATTIIEAARANRMLLNSMEPFKDQFKTSLSHLLKQLESLGIQTIEEFDEALSSVGDPNPILAEIRASSTQSSRLTGYAIFRILLCFLPDAAKAKKAFAYLVLAAAYKDAILAAKEKLGR